MISQKQISSILQKYNPSQLTIGTLGGHSALDICHGAKKYGFQTLVVCQKGREKTYEKYYRTADESGCVDHIIKLDNFSDIVKPSVQKELRFLNTIFVQSRYFWVYCDYKKIENDFLVPIFGHRAAVKLEERDQPKNQYYLLQKAGIRIPKIFKNPRAIDRLAIVKVAEAKRKYERSFFLVSSYDEYIDKVKNRLKKGINKPEDIDKAVIEEFIIGAQVNFNYFYSPLKKRLELMGTDIRRQTDLDGFLRLPAEIQSDVMSLKNYQYEPKLIETGHMAVTVKESLLEKIFDIGERFIKITQKEFPPGIVGPFALQGAVTAEEGREELVIFDVSMRIPGSPGTRFTPYSAYLYGESMSFGERIAKEIRAGVDQNRLTLLTS